MNLIDIIKNHDKNVFDKWELYINVYEDIFSRYKELPINILEIGSQNGGFLDIMAKYFKNAKNIIGIEINEKFKDVEFEDNRIKTVVGDSEDISTKDKVLELAEGEKFNIIIDDASHVSSNIIKNFLMYFPLLKENGIYIIEDLHTSYWKEFEGGIYEKYSSINFLKALVDIINYEHWRINKLRGFVLRYFYEKLNTIIDEFELAKIKSITFFNSLAIIEKDIESNNVIGKHIVRGNYSKVDENTNPYRLNNTFIHDIVMTPGEYAKSVFELEEEIDMLRDRLNQEQNKVRELQDRLNQEENKVKELQDRLNQTENELVMVYLSKSWRLTRPIRKLKRFIRRFI